MKTSDPDAKLGKLLERVAVRDAATAPRWAEPIMEPEQPLLNEFLRSFLIWEAGVPAAREAAARLVHQIVDFNDLRVCLPDDLEAIFGDGSPFAAERSQRLRAAFSDLTRRTHCVTLEQVAEMSKREARGYLDSLDGVPPFVSARVVLIALGVHAMPMDRRTHARLVEAGAVADDSTPESTADHIQRRVKAGDLLGVHLGLQAWADALPEPAPRTSDTR